MPEIQRLGHIQKKTKPCPTAVRLLDDASELAWALYSEEAPTARTNGRSGIATRLGGAPRDRIRCQRQCSCSSTGSALSAQREPALCAASAVLARSGAAGAAPSPMCTAFTPWPRPFARASSAYTAPPRSGASVILYRQQCGHRNHVLLVFLLIRHHLLDRLWTRQS